MWFKILYKWYCAVCVILQIAFGFNIVGLKFTYGGLLRYSWFILAVQEHNLCDYIHSPTNTCFQLSLLQKNAAMNSFIYI